MTVRPVDLTAQHITQLYYHHYYVRGLVAWRSGNAFRLINKVTLRRARLVLRWVTVHGQVNHLGMKPAS